MATIELTQALVERLEALARAEGVTLEVYLERLAQLRGLATRSKLSAEEFDKLLDAEASTGTTYQGTYSRAEIYREHD
jgi:hypothetical protein